MDKRKALFSGRTMVVVVVLAAVVLAAVGCWVAQQMYGLGITGMNNPTHGACTSWRSCSSSACRLAV